MLLRVAYRMEMRPDRHCHHPHPDSHSHHLKRRPRQLGVEMDGDRHKDRDRIATGAISAVEAPAAVAAMVMWMGMEHTMIATGTMVWIASSSAHTCPIRAAAPMRAS